MEDLNHTAIAVIKYPKGATIIAAASAVIFIFLGIFGNALTIVALSKCPKLKMQATTWFVISLSVSDMIFCSFNLPLTATRFIYEAWIFNDYLCKCFPFFFYANFGASLYHIMLIAVNRYMLISSYITYKRVYRPLYVVIMIAAVWLISFCMLLPPLLGIWGNMGLDEETFSCTILKKDGSSPKKFLFLFGILPPFLIVLFCYTRILLSVRRSKMVLRRIQESTGAPCNTSTVKKDDLKLTKTMILIFGGFVLCFVPLMVVNVIDEKISIPTIHVTASILAWASAVINPIIYSISSKTYRNAYMVALGIKRSTNYARAATSGTAKTTTSDSGNAFAL
ncbi:Protein trapped in endoderm-1 [Orchesella cincta]|uniref:Protein trapped in endoderm-1 n=1 Tax=Orchesella cincta TaxID=48709 RepID=A0A1D2NGM4_ORCCI|nr:Protein trapped in endoderm-1 [Orchesella cincta]